MAARYHSVPCCPRGGDWCDPRLAVAADKGPYRDAGIPTPPATFTRQTPSAQWTPYNSPNHGGEGQNVLYGDGHTTFERTPTAGVDGDNIYTVATDNDDPSKFIIGESPWARNAPPFAPVDAEGESLPTTDSVIYP